MKDYVEVLYYLYTLNGWRPTAYNMGSEQDMLHEFRKQIDSNIQAAERIMAQKPSYGREVALVRTKLQEAKMWAGKCLEVLGSELPAEFQDKA